MSDIFSRIEQRHPDIFKLLYSERTHLFKNAHLAYLTYNFEYGFYIGIPYTSKQHSYTPFYIGPDPIFVTRAYEWSVNRNIERSQMLLTKFKRGYKNAKSYSGIFS